ncbi:MFS general substrate transporter [Atractiella rhizophila]|nr:MFS general substrate transporter [Atractiella rhizophila]
MIKNWSEFVANLPKRPSREQRAQARSYSLFAILRSLTIKQWLLFLSGWYAWTMDAYDFFCVSLTVGRLSKQFDKSTHTITTSITLTLLFRSLGAVIFGIISDRYGRKWPLVANLLIIAVLQLGTGFVHEWNAFLAVRSLFGIGMGGIWGLAASNGLENMPVEARGLFSGILQQGYAVGYLIASVVNLTLVHDKNSWRPLFYLGSGLSLGGAVFRLLLPESEFFLKSKAAGNTGGKSKYFFQSVKAALKLHWQRCIFTVLLMAGFSFFSHGSQDLYPTYLQEAKLLSNHQATGLNHNVQGNCGAIVGGILSGYLSQSLGRRVMIIACCLWTACWIPLTLPDTFGGLATGAFFVQSGVQGALGIVPAYLQEISPPAFRATFPGVAYQLGTMVSSASSQIEATAGESSKTTVHGKVVPDYAKIQAIFIGVVAAWIIFWCLVGSEYHGSEFEKAKTAAEEGGGEEIDHTPPPPMTVTSKEDLYSLEKQDDIHEEKAREIYEEHARETVGA